jgi:hypothetical protein
MAVSISQFASDPNLLNTPLWDKQAQILEEFWTGNYTLAVWALGRRSGKTLMAAVTATYAATMLADEYKRHLRPGEKFFIVSVANTIDQARIALQSVKDLITASPILKPLIVRDTTDTLELSNGAVFRALPTSSRSGRGMACPVVIFDELAHALDTEAGNAAGDSLYAALSPSVAQFGGLGKILLLSSPWIQQGVFWDLYKQADSGQYPYMQRVNLPTWEVNRTISQDWLDQEKARDPQLFEIEYGAQFTGNIAAFLDAQLIDAAINYDRGPLPPLDKFKGKYYLSLDPAKGNRDVYAACIVHYESNRLVVDKFYQFSPTWGDGKKAQVVIAEVEDWILEQHKLYNFAQVVLNQYNSAATIQRLSGKLKIRELTWTAPSKTEAYSKLRELVNAGNLELYFHSKAIQQLKNLTVRYRANGTWDVSGGTGAAVDDYPAALAGGVLNARQGIQRQPIPAVSFSTW